MSATVGGAPEGADGRGGMETVLQQWEGVFGCTGPLLPGRCAGVGIGGEVRLIWGREGDV